MTMDEESPSQQSIWMRDNMPPGQDKIQDQAKWSSQTKDITSYKDDYTAKLITMNNESNGDSGVNSVLLALKNLDDKVKVVHLNKIKKEPIQAGLGF